MLSLQKRRIGSIRLKGLLGLAVLLSAVLVTLLVVLPAGVQAVSYNTQEIAFVQLLNQYRANNGMGPLLVSDLLSDSAEKHSKDMAKYGFFNHLTSQSDWFPAGATWRQRMTACGYPSNSDVGENIAAGYDTAAEVFTAWKNSYGHNGNMLSASWKVIGVGCEQVPGSSYGTYWTTDFGCYVDGTAHEAGAPSPLDTVAPTVTITSPGAGEDLSGRVYVTVTAGDTVGVSRVEVYVDGDPAGTDSAKPYSIAWDTSGLTSGSYTLEARAYDAAGNVGVHSIMVHVTAQPGATTTTTTSTTLPTQTFSDVPVTHRFYQPITVLAAAGVVNGYSDGAFNPDGLVTRAQFAKIIVLAVERHTATIDNAADPSFTDVPYTGGAYPFDYVEEAATLEIVRGYSDGTFRPDLNVTRLQLAQMLVRVGAADLATPPAGYACSFGDVPSYAREAVRIAKYNGLLSGKTATSFDPYGSASRGHVAKMVYGLLQVLGL